LAFLKTRKGFFMSKIILILSLVLFNCGIGFADTRIPRYISLAPSTTEILFALGLDDQIVGVSTFCNYPLKAKDKPKVGNFSQPNMEKIISLAPDVVFCTGLEQSPVIRQLRELKVKVCVSDPANMQELFVSIREIGSLTGKIKEAESLISGMKQEIEKVQAKVKPVTLEKRPTVFVEYWFNPLMSAGKGSFIDELVTLAGGVNIAGDMSKPYSYFSPELVIKRNPQVIILAYMVNSQDLLSLSQRLGWSDISAVKNNRVYNDINSDLLLRPSPRIVQGLKLLHDKFYPENE